jgi:ribonuclease BN (tRNA processing enzyme)
MKAGELPGGIDFDLWGCRGSRSLVPARSVYGNNTSCYSILDGDQLLVLDAGRGLAALGDALSREPRFRRVRRLRLLVSHAHLDHWEGLKDAGWFWEGGRRLEVTVSGPPQALAAIRAGYRHPSYVPLEVLADGRLAALDFSPLQLGRAVRISRWTLRSFLLNHYSGSGRRRRFLQAYGFQLTRPGGPQIAYLCDHEPTPVTRALEQRLLAGAHLAVLDAHFADVAEHAYGHGSIEHAAGVARSRPAALILAGHHGPLATDERIAGALGRHGRGLDNLEPAVEGTTYRWSAARRSFSRVQVTRNGTL